MKQKIIFVHVGKTAGSSFNQFLRQRLTGECHCEKYLSGDGLSFSNLAHLRQLEYVSGHVRHPVFAAHFPPEEYFSLTFLREPCSQLLSHINWVIRIHDISPEFFHGHPRAIREMCLELRSLDLERPDVFIKALITFEDQFRNDQSRYFTTVRGADRGRCAIETLSTLGMVGLTEFYETSLRQFVTLTQLDTTIEVQRENQNHHYRVHPDIYSHPLIREFVTEYNHADSEVYEHFAQKFCNAAPGETRPTPTPDHDSGGPS